MEYKKVKVTRIDPLTGKKVKKNYLRWEGRGVIFQAPDTPEGKSILDRRRKR